VTYRQRAEKALGRKLKRNEHVHHHSATQLVICSPAYHKWLHRQLHRTGLSEQQNGRPRHYILRGVDETIWRNAQARAANEGYTMRWIILTMLRHYADGE
jgi:hypothetical protein